MIFRRWKTNSSELRKKLKEYGLNVDEITHKLKITDQQLILSKVYGSWAQLRTCFQLKPKIYKVFLE